MAHVSLLTPFPPFSPKKSNHHWVYSSFHPFRGSAGPWRPIARRSDQNAIAFSTAIWRMLSKEGKELRLGEGHTYTPRALGFGKVECEQIDFREICGILGKFCSQSVDGRFHRWYSITSTQPINQSVVYAICASRERPRRTLAFSIPR